MEDPHHCFARSRPSVYPSAAGGGPVGPGDGLAPNGRRDSGACTPRVPGTLVGDGVQHPRSACGGTPRAPAGHQRGCDRVRRARGEAPPQGCEERTEEVGPIRAGTTRAHPSHPCCRLAPLMSWVPGSGTINSAVRPKHTGHREVAQGTNRGPPSSNHAAVAATGVPSGPVMRTNQVSGLEQSGVVA